MNLFEIMTRELIEERVGLSTAGHFLIIITIIIKKHCLAFVHPKRVKMKRKTPYLSCDD